MFEIQYLKQECWSTAVIFVMGCYVNNRAQKTQRSWVNTHHLQILALLEKLSLSPL